MRAKIMFAAMLALVLILGPNLAPAWEKVENLPLRDDGDKRSLLLMIDRQVNYLSKIPNRTFRMGGIRVSRERLLATAKALRLVVLKHHGRPEFGLRIREQFLIYRTNNPAKQGKALFTGYYDPILPVSDKPSERFRFPIYRPPDDLRHAGKDNFFKIANGKKTPYFTRAQIDGQNIFAGKGYEIAWTEDYVSLYYLMVQGSGKVKYAGGRTSTIHFAASNGHPYKSAARACMDDGKCPGGYDRNLAWFRAHPAETKKYFLLNPRYIFFRIDEREVIGVQNIPLTPKRSIATDKSIYPPGAIALAHIPMPIPAADGTIKHRPVSFLVADCDTGSAIKGPGRADFYYGTGESAGKQAGSTHGWGDLYYLLVK